MCVRIAAISARGAGCLGPCAVGDARIGDGGLHQTEGVVVSEDAEPGLAEAIALLNKGCTLGQPLTT